MDSGFPEGMGYYRSISEPGIGYYKLLVKEASKEPPNHTVGSSYCRNS